MTFLQNTWKSCARLNIHEKTWKSNTWLTHVTFQVPKDCTGEIPDDVTFAANAEKSGVVAGQGDLLDSDEDDDANRFAILAVKKAISKPRGQLVNF